MKKWHVFGIGILLLFGVVLMMGMASPETETEGAGFRKWRNSPLGRMFLANKGRLLTLRAELNITEEQRGEIRQVIEKHKGEFQSVAQKIGEAKRNLRLTDTQAEKVQQIISRHFLELYQIRKETHPRVRQNLEQLKEEVADILDEKQEQKWRERFETLERLFPPDPSLSDTENP